MVWNTIINGKSQTLLSDFFFGEPAAVHRLGKHYFNVLDIPEEINTALTSASRFIVQFFYFFFLGLPHFVFVRRETG